MILAELDNKGNMLSDNVAAAMTSSLASAVTVDIKSSSGCPNTLMIGTILMDQILRMPEKAPKQDLTGIDWAVCANASGLHGYVWVLHLPTRKSTLLDSFAPDKLAADRAGVKKKVWKWIRLQQDARVPDAAKLPELQDVRCLDAKQQRPSDMNCYLFLGLYSVVALLACRKAKDMAECIDIIHGWMACFDGKQFEDSARNWLASAVRQGVDLPKAASSFLKKVGLDCLLAHANAGSHKAYDNSVTASDPAQSPKATGNAHGNASNTGRAGLAGSANPSSFFRLRR
jgi:hypothetical protein